MSKERFKATVVPHGRRLNEDVAEVERQAEIVTLKQEGHLPRDIHGELGNPLETPDEQILAAFGKMEEGCN